MEVHIYLMLQLENKDLYLIVNNFIKLLLT